MDVTGSLKISIITPSYNQGGFIEDTINSIIDQNYPNLEYIIIDGGSKDSTVDIIEKYKNDISHWVSEKDNGQSHAINKGFLKASGDIIAWLNSDDLYLPEVLKLVAETFNNHPEVDLIYGDVLNFYPDGAEKYYKVKEFEPVDFLSRVSIHQPAVFWRRKILDEIGFLDEDLHYVMDYDLWARILFKYKTLKINKPLAKFRIHNNSKTSDNPPKMYLESRIVLSRFFNSLPNDILKKKLIKYEIYNNENDADYKLNIKLKDNDVEDIFNNYILNCGIQEYTFGNYSKANKLFFKSVNLKNSVQVFLFLIKNNLFRIIKTNKR